MRAAAFSALALSASQLLTPLCIPNCEAQDVVHLPHAEVTAATQLDWLYPCLRSSPELPPAGLLDEYSWQSQSYEFFGPRNRPAQAVPLLLFISPQNETVSWEYWGPVCRRHGIVFAEVRDAGNGEPVSQRVRAAIEVLGEMRRRYPIDTDRTYISGFSGGAAVASRIAFHLPEYFGGVICIGIEPMFPLQPSLIDRVRERLSIATICGQNELAALPAKLRRQHEFEAAAIRSHTHIVPGMRHDMPRPGVLESAYLWLETTVSKRRALAKRYSSTRISDTPTRRVWAQRSLNDAQLRLQAGEVAVALHQLMSLVERWPDVPTAADATVILERHAAMLDRPWEQVWKADELGQLRARAIGTERLVTSRSRRLGDAQRAMYAQQAIHLWEALGKEDGTTVIDEQRMAKLRSVAAMASTKIEEIAPLFELRFALNGAVTRWEAFDGFCERLRACGYRVIVDPEVLAEKSRWLKETVKFKLPAASYSEVARAVLAPMGLRHRKSGNEISIMLKP